MENASVGTSDDCLSWDQVHEYQSDSKDNVHTNILWGQKCLHYLWSRISRITSKAVLQALNLYVEKVI